MFKNCIFKIDGNSDRKEQKIVSKWFFTQGISD